MTDSVFNTGGPQPKKQNRNQNSSTQSQCVRSQATIYRPLDKSKREIRICDLSTAPELSDLLHCFLRIVPIDEAGNFVAFSYVWGTDAASETISVDGSRFQSGQTWLLVFDDFVRDSQDVPISEQEISLVRYQYGRTQSA